MNEVIKELTTLYNDMGPLIPQSNKKHIYHYTSTQGLQGILSNFELRFSDRNFLNDSSEGSYSLDLLCEINSSANNDSDEFKYDILKRCKFRKKELVNEKFHTYQCSFSKNGDNLPLWNYYTKGDNIKGYNIKFNVNKLKESLTPNNIYSERVLKPTLGEVIYVKKEQIEIIKKVVMEFKKIYITHQGLRHDTVDFLIDKVLLNGKFFKMDCFKVEEEFRIVFDTMLLQGFNDKGIPEKEEFREINGYFIPYIQKGFSDDSLEAITMSPTLDENLTKASLKRIINNKSVSILKSKIPVRY